jgi:hypothetical protein
MFAKPAGGERPIGVTHGPFNSEVQRVGSAPVADQLAALLGSDTVAASVDHAAPVFELSAGPPTMAVLPSVDSATETP